MWTCVYVDVCICVLDCMRLCVDVWTCVGVVTCQRVRVCLSMFVQITLTATTTIMPDWTFVIALTPKADWPAPGSMLKLTADVNFSSSSSLALAIVAD